MTEHKTFPGKTYVVTSKAGCDITDASGELEETCLPGKQKAINAPSDILYTSAPAVVRETFNTAPSIGSSGGGVEIKFDTKPTSGSTNAVTSGGLYNILYTGNLSLGQGASASSWGTALGNNAKTTGFRGVAVGEFSLAAVDGSTALGSYAKATKAKGTAIGRGVTLNDESATAIGNQTTDGTSQTLFYVMAAGSPLATTYENGEACLGYVVKDSSGNISACGTRKLSELLTNNTAFAPAALDLDADPPTPFLPTGIMEPIEFPEDLTE